MFDPVPSASMPPFYQSTATSVDASQGQSLEENASSTDNHHQRGPSVASFVPSPSLSGSRRHSFAVGSTVFSPKEEWQAVDMQSDPSNNPFLDQSNSGAYLAMEQGHQNDNLFNPHNVNTWSMGGDTNSATPFHGFDPMSTDFNEGSTSMLQRSLSGNQIPFTLHPTNMFANLAGHNHNSDHAFPVNQQPKEWFAVNQSMAKKMSPGSPPSIKSHNELRKGDGIRKKNARFDIPAERNLTNIDRLIAESTDDQEIKELKQQKRLLRNRQAALDSRQRKKIHTERLEDEKKHFNVVISDLEDEMTALKTRLDQLLEEKQNYQAYVTSLAMDKEEMIRAHTIETGNLRKRVNILTEHVHRLESEGAHQATKDDAFSDFDNMDGLHLTGSWHDPAFLPRMATEPVVEAKVPTVNSGKRDMPANNAQQKTSAQGGLLFMLFLVGAFVMSSRETPSIPHVSEDVRAASATLLDNVLKDAGIGSDTTSVGALASAPRPSQPAWSSTASGDMMDTAIHTDHAKPSMLDELSGDLLAPSEQQSNEHIFSLSASQYNNINDQAFVQNQAAAEQPSQGRKNLAEALAAMRMPNKRDGAADVYTRSLLWDQIPNNVVRNFAKMVADGRKTQPLEQSCHNEDS